MRLQLLRGRAIPAERFAIAFVMIIKEYYVFSTDKKLIIM